MQLLSSGSYFGQQKRIIKYDNLIITDTEYTHDRVGWHYHKNAYFTFLLKGRLSETNRKESYQLLPGSLLFHHWQDPHYSIKEPGYARGFHVEIKKEWFDTNHIGGSQWEGSFQLQHPNQKKLFNQIYLETKILDTVTELSIQGLLMQSLAIMKRVDADVQSKVPKWVKTVWHILNDQCLDKLSLDYLAGLANVHPVHLSRSFPKYFHCTLGKYLRSLRIEKSISLLHNRHLSMMVIAHQCGFSDESHFIRSFKEAKGITPALYRKGL